MAANDEVIRLLLDMGVSAQNVQAVSKELQSLRTTTMQVDQGYEVLERQVGEYDLVEQKVTQTVVQQTTALQILGIELEKQQGLYSVVTAEMGTLTTRANTLKGSGGAGGYGILGVSYAVQDFTSVLSGGQGLGRALSSVQNNIPIILASMGAGAGMAGVVSIVSVGIGLLIDNWDKIERLWGKGGTAEEAERMKDLAKATKEAAEANEKLLKTLPQWQREGGANVKRAVEAFGGEAVLKDITKGLKDTQGDFGPDANRNMAKTFLANLQKGDPAAVRMMNEMPMGFGGGVRQVLQGGKTPDEEGAERVRELAKMAAEKDREFEQKKRERQEVEKMNERGKDEAIRMRVRMDAEKKRDADAALKEGVHNAQDLARRMVRQNAPQAAGKLGHIGADATIAELNASQQETINQMTGNQATIARQLANLRRNLADARRV